MEGNDMKRKTRKGERNKMIRKRNVKGKEKVPWDVCSRFPHNPV